MTEAQHTAKWIREMRKKHPEWTIIKFNDRLTKGIPDLAICSGSRTLWVECKRYDTPRPKLQNWHLMRMGGVYRIFGPILDQFETPSGCPIHLTVEELLCLP